MRANVARSLVRYYAALRISATAATVVLPVEFRRGGVPIVRGINSIDPRGFDARELISLGGRAHVVLLPASHAARNTRSRIHVN